MPAPPSTSDQPHSDLYIANKSLRADQEFPSTIAMAMKYVHPTPEHKIAAIAKLTSHNFSHSDCSN